MKHVEQKPSTDEQDDLAECEEEVARARQAFDQGLREATRVGTRAVRRFVVPGLWGIAIAGGALALLAIVRLARRRPAETALVRIVVEQRLAYPILPALGAAVARAVLQRFIEDVPDSSRLSLPMGQSKRLAASPGSATTSAKQGPFVSGQLETLG